MMKTDIRNVRDFCEPYPLVRVKIDNVTDERAGAKAAIEVWRAVNLGKPGEWKAALLEVTLHTYIYEVTRTWPNPAFEPGLRRTA
jgi:hypothetical protein